ncbi:MAG: sodium:solute symporter family protein [Saprospiraceae bacterium]|nr:sodium:solute symporter family protein [Saprospiraceae bacterium]
MNLATLDWAIIAAFFVLSLAIGIIVSKRSGKDSSEFFLSGRSMPWWLLGFSMVATTFSADTPNLVTDIVRKNGVAGNWAWWAFLLTGMLTVFVYAKLWRRSGVLTDVEFYEIRYSGPMAAFLRGFRAIYLGVFFNVMIMATVCLAGIKIGGVMLGLSPTQTLLLATSVTVIYSVIGGFAGVIWTDFFQFVIAMIGSLAAAIFIVNLPQVGGLDNLLSNPAVSPKLNVLPDFNDMNVLIPLFIMPLAVQWWSVWYPGAEPGGGGYIAQRMLAAKNENHAMGATLFFNIMHYALRPWPWILVALASIIVFPDFASLQKAFPNVNVNVINDDLAYPAMMTLLPSGLLGVIIASLIAAFMSTIATHLNWGSSYVVNDWYKRFVKPEASEKQLVTIGRISTVVLMVLAALLALALTNALQAFNILLQIGAGTGLLFILRWFWWRINAYSELAAMVISFLVAIYFEFFHTRVFGFAPMLDYQKLLTGVGITTIGWLSVALLTPPADHKVLVSFYKLVKPASIGWQPVIDKALANGELQASEVTTGKLPLEIGGMLIGAISVYAALFAVGFWIYGNVSAALIATVIAAIGGYLLFRIWKKVQ